MHLAPSVVTVSLEEHDLIEAARTGCSRPAATLKGRRTRLIPSAEELFVVFDVEERADGTTSDRAMACADDLVVCSTEQATLAMEDLLRQARASSTVRDERDLLTTAEGMATAALMLDEATWELLESWAGGDKDAIEALRAIGIQLTPGGREPEDCGSVGLVTMLDTGMEFWIEI